jgi:flagellar biosynthesis component FlhA
LAGRLSEDRFGRSSVEFVSDGTIVLCLHRVIYSIPEYEQDDPSRTIDVVVIVLLRTLLSRFLRRALPQLKVLSHAEVQETKTIRLTSLVGAAS